MEDLKVNYYNGRKYIFLSKVTDKNVTKVFCYNSKTKVLYKEISCNKNGKIVKIKEERILSPNLSLQQLIQEFINEILV